MIFRIIQIVVFRCKKTTEGFALIQEERHTNFFINNKIGEEWAAKEKKYSSHLQCAEKMD